MTAPGDIQIVFSTVPDRDCGSKIADHLVEYKLAACVNLLPAIESTYRWKGELQHDTECLLMIKARAADYEAVARAIRTMHPYELPEIIAVTLDDGLPEYLNWISSSLDKN